MGRGSVKQYKELDRVAGEGVDIEVEGESIRILPFTLRDQAAARAKMRTDALLALDQYFEATSQEFTPDDRRRQRAEEITKPIGDEMLGEWLDTLEGLYWLVWRTLTKVMPKLTPDECERKFGKPEVLGRIAATIAAVSGWGRSEAGAPSPKAEREEPTLPTSGKATSPG